MTVNLSAIEYLLPLLSFLVVFLISIFLIKKSKLIESLWIEVFISFIIAAVFVSADAPRNFVLAIIPLFAVVLIGLFLIMALSGFITKDFPSKAVGTTFIVVLALIFLVTAFFVFSAYVGPYLPGNVNLIDNPGNPALLNLFSWLYSPQVFGAILLIGISAVVAWVVIKEK